MEVGLYMSCFMDRDVESIAAWSARNGFKTVEFHAGPRYRHLNWEAIAEGDTEPLLGPLRRHGLELCSLMYGAIPFLDPDPAVRVKAARSLKTLIRAAKSLGGPVVSTFSGRDPLRSPQDNLDDFQRVWEPLVDEAEAAGVRIALENCPMSHVWPPVYNIAVTPALWEEIFRRVPSRNLGLSIDPSHFVFQGIDYVAATLEFRDRIFMAQAKDTEMMSAQRREGHYSNAWWRHRVPGQGDVDWCKFIGALMEAGYDGVITVEHEDPIWSGTPERVERGVVLAAQHLRQFI